MMVKLDDLEKGKIFGEKELIVHRSDRDFMMTVKKATPTQIDYIIYRLGQEDGRDFSVNRIYEGRFNIGERLFSRFMSQLGGGGLW